MPISDSNADKLVNRIDKLVKVIEGKRDIGKVIEGEQGTSNDPAPIVRIEERLTWHTRVGWIAISVTAAALLSLFRIVLWQLPRTADVQNVVNTAFENEVSPLNDKISAINEKLAGLTATMEFLKPDVSKNLPKVMKQSLQESGDLELGLRTVAALATKAQEQKVTTDPQGISEIGRQLILNQGNFESNVRPLAWDAVISLLSYRSFITASEDPSYSKPSTLRPVTTPPGPLPYGIRTYLNGGSFAGPAQQPLDGVWWENVTFKNMTISYHGGPTVLRNVKFENCKFQLFFTIPSEALGRAILASNEVSISIPSS